MRIGFNWLRFKKVMPSTNLNLGLRVGPAPKSSGARTETHGNARGRVIRTKCYYRSERHSSGTLVPFTPYPGRFKKYVFLHLLLPGPYKVHCLHTPHDSHTVHLLYRFCCYRLRVAYLVCPSKFRISFSSAGHFGQNVGHQKQWPIGVIELWCDRMQLFQREYAGFC